MPRKPLDYDACESRYIDATIVQARLREAYSRAADLPKLRKKIRATLKSAAGAVNNARRFYEAASAERHGLVRRPCALKSNASTAATRATARACG